VVQIRETQNAHNFLVGKKTVKRIQSTDDIKFFLCSIKQHNMNMYGGVDV
jgi:hypothetical protein